MKKLLITILSALLALGAVEKNRDTDGKRHKDVVQGDVFEVNNVKALVANNGWLFWGGGPSGFIVPTPTFSNNDGNFATVFASGIWTAGKVNGVVRTSLAYYGSDMTPGLWDAYASDPTGVGSRENDEYKMYYYYSQSHIDYLQGLLDAPDPTESQKIHTFAQGEMDRAATANAEWAAVAVVKQGAPATPPGHVATFTVYHDSFLSVRSSGRGANNPLNVQIRMLAWAFRQAGPLNNAVFVKMEVINKNAVPITDMYMSIWSDPDLGQFQDDLVGSDKSLGLGYCYNGGASDAQYTAVLGIAPPAVGYDYFQGPIVDSPGVNVIQRGTDFFVYLNEDDNYVAIPGDVVLPNKYIRPATSFYYYNNTDEPSSPAGWYNFMHGLTEQGSENQVKLAAIAANLTTQEDAAFFFNGDPESGTGWLDSNPDDRRFILNNGPFTLGVSDGTQVFGDPGYNATVFGVFTSFGISNLNSVSSLKLDDQVIEATYQKAFKVAPLPPAPRVTVNPGDQQFQFSWQSGAVNFDGRVVTTEDYTEDGYSFIAYELVAFSNAALAGSENYTLLKTFDVADGITVIKDNVLDFNLGTFVEKVVWVGTDSGVDRDIVLTEDIFSTAAEPVFLNYTPYHFGLRAVAYNPTPNSGESKLRKGEWAVGLTNLVPKKQDIGTTVTAEYNQLLTAASVGADADGGVIARVVDPYALRNAKYKVTFSTLAAAKPHTGYPGGVIPANTIVWNMVRVDSIGPGNSVENQVLSDMPQAPNPAEDFAYTRVIDGIAFTVSGPPDDFKNFLMVANGNGALNPPDYAAFAFNSSGFPHPTTGDRPDGSRQQVNGSTWGIHTGGNGSRSSYASFLSRAVTGRGGWGHLVPDDFEVRFTAGPNYAWENFGNGQLNQVPMEVWNITKGFRALIAHLDDPDGITGPDHIFNFSGLDHEISGGSDDPQTDWYYWYEPNDLSAGDAGYQAWLASGDYGNHGSEIIGRQVLVNWNGGSVNDPNFPANVDALMPEVGSVIRYITNKPNSAAAAFQVTSPGPPDLLNTAKAEANFNKVGVWPNPYYGSQPLQSNAGGFMQFINLPKLDANGYVQVKIYSLNGDLVRNLRYTGGSGTLNWQLDNDANLRVASGIYIAYIKHRNTSKIIKMAVNIGENRPKTF